jgi:hypothetical protein
MSDHTFLHCVIGYDIALLIIWLGLRWTSDTEVK